MEIQIRNFENTDYSQCEELVNEAWRFDKIFESKTLVDTALRMYTKGALCSSNIKLVAVDQNKVVGFLFGLNLLAKSKPQGRIKFVFETLIALNFRRMDKKGRNSFLNAVREHNSNRLKADPKHTSEICLFVVSQGYRGKNIGTKLWDAFRDTCVASRVNKVRVETNKLGASSFYERLGFKHAVDFYSPLHEMGTPGGQACMYEYDLT